MKTLSILGSTGSIGKNVLEVIRLNKDYFKIFALSCYKNVELLNLQCLEFNPEFAVVSSLDDANFLKESFKNKIKTEILFEKGSYSYIASHEKVTHVVAAITGFAGLQSTFDAAKAGKEILLANKESMVMAGPLILSEVARNKSKIIPIDSEHNAIFQILNVVNERKSEIERIILTASGGPFLNYPINKIADVTVEEALNHPNWKMGDKITIDSATMMNKGLEVIEAYYLFNQPKSKIDIIIHPQSIVHSLVEFIDGSVLSQLGFSDMKIPISFSLGYPERIISGLGGINLSKIKSLTFYEPDFNKFPCLKLCYDVLDKDLAYSIILNLSNEIAVEAFLKKQIKFNQIFQIVDSLLNKTKTKKISNIDELFVFSNQVVNETKNLLLKL